MKKPVLILTALLTFCLFVKTTSAQTAPATTTGNVDAMMASSDNTSVTAFLVKVAKLNETLSAAGPFTVFAPTNDALTKLSTPKLDSLMADPAKLATLIKAHTVTGKYAKDDIVKALNASKDRKVVFKTIDGGDLTLTYTGGKLVLTDSKGNSANVLLYNLQATNGVVHGLSDVLTGK